MVQNVQFMMHVIPTTHARKTLAAIISSVRFSNTPVAIGRHNKAEVLVIKFPEHANNQLNTVTNMNQFGGAFEFLIEEPELYTRADLKKPYV